MLGQIFDLKSFLLNKVISPTIFFDKIKFYEVKKFENRKNKTTFIPPTRKVGEVKMVLDFRFGQLFINKTEIVMG